MSTTKGAMSLRTAPTGSIKLGLSFVEGIQYSVFAVDGLDKIPAQYFSEQCWFVKDGMANLTPAFSYIVCPNPFLQLNEPGVSLVGVLQGVEGTKKVYPVLAITSNGVIPAKAESSAESTQNPTLCRYVENGQVKTAPNFYWLFEHAK